MGVRNEDDWIGQDRAYLRYRCKRGGLGFATFSHDLELQREDRRKSEIERAERLRQNIFVIDSRSL